MSETEIYIAALDYFGADEQVIKLLEEMSELQNEICKDMQDRSSKDAIAKEIADVSIMLNQMILLYGIQVQVEQWKERRLDRLKEQIPARWRVDL